MDEETIELGARFWTKVDKTGDCWLWTGALSKDGYGQYRVKGRTRSAHTLAYRATVGPVPDGLMLDHLCRVPRCVNPVHLEPVTNRINVLRGVSVIAVNARKTVCVNGHPFDTENTYHYPDGRRGCKTCNLALGAVWDAQQVECPVCAKTMRRGSLNQHKKRKHGVES